MYRDGSTRTHRRRWAQPPLCIKHQSQGHSHKPLKVCQKKKKKNGNERSSFFFSGVETALCCKLFSPHLEHFWYKHMQALDSLAPKANKPHFPITPWLRFSRGTPVYAGSSKAVISASFSSATNFLCLSLCYNLLNNDIWPRDGTELKVFQRQTTSISARSDENRSFLACYVLPDKLLHYHNPTFFLFLLFSGLIVAPPGQQPSTCYNF